MKSAVGLRLWIGERVESSEQRFFVFADVLVARSRSAGDDQAKLIFEVSIKKVYVVLACF